MSHPYAEAFFGKQQHFRDPIKFYFKQNHKNNHDTALYDLRDLVRPRLKIAIVTETWPPEINGVALSLLQLCKGLQQLGHKILLIRPEQREVCADFKPNKECLVKAQTIPRYPSLQFGWPQYIKVSQALSDFAPDIVHIVTEGPLGLTALQAAKAQKIPITSGFHSPFQDFSRFFDLAFLVKPIQHYLRWFHNNTQLTCVPSVDTEKALRQFGVTCDLHIVGRGVDIQRFSPTHRSEALRERWGVNADTTVMLYVGRLSPEKEIELIIETFDAQRSAQKNVQLVIVGDGPDLSRLKQFQGAEQTIFMGSLTGQDLAVAYASADVFVFASQVETFGNVVLEAMASGLPIVAYNYACAQQYVKQQQTGWLSPRGQAAQFIQDLMTLPSRYQLNKMGEQAAYATQRAGWQKPVQQLENALYQVAQESVFVS
ncbi:glycosyltransferase family 4 protein [Acinetobacter pullicarnis]|uniref:glycosyltransferase family 4 protein n=1 Tax=Acinetobacter pullicarnis TaxID=2576829 RepID=UPI00111F9520|nr:glycosyltransferase family 1 protein [Acinetobacter pullicarnis]